MDAGGLAVDAVLQPHPVPVGHFALLGGMLVQSASTAAAAPAARIGRIFCMGKILTTTFSARR